VQVVDLGLVGVGLFAELPFGVRIVLDQPGFAYLIGSFDNVGGHDTSFWARIYLDPLGLAIAGQPKDRYVEPGATAIFEVEALGSSEISYEWYKDGIRIPGESSNILSIAGIGEGDEGLYTARVFNAAGVEFTAPAELILLGDPAVVAHPQSVVAESGDDISLSGNVIGASPFSLQWLKDGAPVGGATGPTLSLSGVTAADAGLYQLQGTNSSGEATTFAAGLSIELPASPKSTIASSSPLNYCRTGGSSSPVPSTPLVVPTPKPGRS